MNVSSPEFIPDSSFSSSNGDNTLNNTFCSELGGPDVENQFSTGQPLSTSKFATFTQTVNSAQKPTNSI